MSDIVITKKSGDNSCGSGDSILQYMHFPSGNSTSGACTPPACPTNLYTWKQIFLFDDCDSFAIRNFESIDFELCSPVGDFPIPELRDTCNILVKAEGNRLVVSVAWTVVCEKVDCCGTGTIVTSCPAQTEETVQQQIDFFINTLQTNSIEDAYTISIDGITRFGAVRKLSLSKSASTPITYNARLEFIAGNVVAGES